MASPAFGTIGTQLQGTSSSMNVDVPDSVAADDIIVVVAFIDGAATVTAQPTGFTHAPDSPVDCDPSPAGGRHSMAVMWKRATGADDTGSTYDFTLSSSTYRNAAAARYTGAVTSGNPWDVTDPGVDITNGTASPAVQDTTTVADTLLVWASTNWAGGAWTPPSSFTERRDTGDQVCSMADLAQASAGDTGSISGSCAGSNKRTAWLGALKSTSGGTDATVTPSAIAVSASVPAPTLSAGSTVSPSAIAATASVPAPALATGSTVGPNAIAVSASVPAPTLSTGSTVGPSAIAAAASVPSATLGAGATATPDAIACAVSMPAPAITGQAGATVAPDAILCSVSMPAPVVSAGSAAPTGSWYGLLSILQEARDLARADASTPPAACPNDGEPLRTGPHGELYCPFDGYRPGDG